MANTITPTTKINENAKQSLYPETKMILGPSSITKVYK